MITKLVWIDMEMTGLDVEKEAIIEVACVISNLKMEVLEEYETVVYQPVKYLENMDDWNKTHHAQSGLLSRIEFGKAQDQVEKELIAILQDHFLLPKERPILAGNSIGQDRLFISRYMTELDKLLHYRMLDVSSWKIIFEEVYGKKFDKQKNHRALDDIYESIEELKFYMKLIPLTFPQ